MTLPFQRRIVIPIVVALLAGIVLRRTYIFAANRAAKGAESSAYKAVAGPFDRLTWTTLGVYRSGSFAGATEYVPGLSVPVW